VLPAPSNIVQFSVTIGMQFITFYFPFLFSLSLIRSIIIVIGMEVEMSPKAIPWPTDCSNRLFPTMGLPSEPHVHSHQQFFRSSLYFVHLSGYFGSMNSDDESYGDSKQVKGSVKLVRGKVYSPLNSFMDNSRENYDLGFLKILCSFE